MRELAVLREKMMRYTRYFLFLLSFVGCFLLCFLIACGPSTLTTPTSSTPTRSTPVSGGVTVSGGITPVPTTLPVPPTSTDCPAAGTARVPVFAPLRLGTHPTIVYTFHINSTNTSLLKRYDVVTGTTTDIVKMPDFYIDEAEVSADGQWVLVVGTGLQVPYQIRMVRMDGQGLQTLYCERAGGINVPLLSPDQKSLVFIDIRPEEAPTNLYLLDMTNGALRTEISLTKPISNVAGYDPVAWRDNVHIYVVVISPNSNQYVSLLDTRNGTLQKVTQFPEQRACWSVDGSIDGTQLFTSQCTNPPNSGNSYAGPSSITVQPATGGSQKTIYKSSTLAVTEVRAITSATLLLVISNTDGDTSQNGLWKIEVDGSGLTRISPDDAGNVAGLAVTQYPWSNVSRDGRMYVMGVYNTKSKNQSLLFGSLSGGTRTTFATDSHDSTFVETAGWTSM